MSSLIRVPCVPACQCGLRANVLAWQRGLRANMLACLRGLHVNVQKASQLLIFTCQCANKRASVLCGVPTCQKACQFFNLACQFLKHSSYEMLREISMLYYYIKSFTLYLLDIILYISYVYVSYIKIMLYFISIFMSY